MMTIDELINGCRKLLHEEKFPCGIGFRLPPSKNIAYLQIANSYKGEGLFRLHVSVSREGSSMMHSHYYHNDMTEEEMRKYLAGDEDTEKIRQSILELSASVDDKEGEFPSDY